MKMNWAQTNWMTVYGFKIELFMKKYQQSVLLFRSSLVHFLTTNREMEAQRKVSSILLIENYADIKTKYI